MKLKKGLSLNALGDEFVIVADDINVFRGMVKVNNSGAIIFSLMQEGKKKEDIVKEISKKYDVEKDIVEKDFDEFFEIIHDAGLMEDE